MKVAFKADSPALLKIAEIGEFLAETNDLLRRNLVFSVLAAVRDGEIPLRNKAGLKVPSDVLRDTKRKARLVAKQKAESRARKPCLLDFRLADLRDEKRRYLASEGPVLSITHGIRIPEYDEKIIDLTREKQLLVEWEREQRDLDKAIQLNNFNRRGYVWLSDLAGWLRDDQGFDVTIASPDRAANLLARALAEPAQQTVDQQEQLDDTPSGTSEKVAPDTTGMVAWQAVILNNWSKIEEVHGKRPAAKNVMNWLEKFGPRDTIPKEQPNFRSLQWIDNRGNMQSVTIRRIGNILSEWRKTGIIPT